MRIKVQAYGIAKDIIEGRSIEMELSGSKNIETLKKLLVERFPDFSKLATLKFAVNTDYQEDDFILNEQDEVVIIPPVSGG